MICEQLSGVLNTNFKSEGLFIPSLIRLSVFVFDAKKNFETQDPVRKTFVMELDIDDYLNLEKVNSAEDLKFSNIIPHQLKCGR